MTRYQQNVLGLWCSSKLCARPYTVSLVCNTTYRPHWKALYLAHNVCSQHTTHSKSPKNYSDLLHLPQDYIRDIGLWMEENKLKLNNDKTKAICFRSSSVNTTSQYHHRQSLCISDTEFAGIVHNLSFIFDSNLSVKQHIIKTCQAACIKIRSISSFHQCLSEDATNTLVSSCILSRLDYCYSILTGYLQTVIKPFQQ